MENDVWAIWFKDRGTIKIRHIPRQITIIPHRRSKIDKNSDIPVNYQKRWAGLEPELAFARDQAELIAEVDSLDPLVHQSLNTYIEWLNQQFGVSDFEEVTAEHPYSFDDFFRYEGTNDEGFYWERHHETQVLIDTQAGVHRHIIMSAGTADDGGPAYLFVLIDQQYEKHRIVQITQEFDTLFSLVYFDSGYKEEERSRGIVPFGWSPQEASGETPQIEE